MQVSCHCPQFQAVKFPVIDSMCKSEILGGAGNFTELLDFDPANPLCSRCLFCKTIKRLAI
jgi:hypothetical protein